MDSSSLKVQCQAALALRNLASDERFQLEIVKASGLPPLLRLLQSSYLPLILSSAACVRNVSIHPENESPIIETGFLNPLITLLSFEENEEVQCHAISTLRNLAASSEKNKGQIIKAGAVAKIKDLVLHVPLNVQSEMTACVAVLALSDDLKSQLLEMGICEVLIPLTESPSIEVQGNSAAALGNLSMKDGRTTLDDYAAFNDVWEKPAGGLHAYLFRFLSSQDATFQHIAVWTMVQFLESGDPQLVSSIRNSQSLMSRIQQLAQSPNTSRTSSIRSGRSQSQSYDDPDAAEGQGEIAILARRIQDMVDGDDGLLHAGPIGSSVVGSAVSGSFQESAYRSSREQGRLGEHDELRKSLSDAFGQ